MRKIVIFLLLSLVLFAKKENINTIYSLPDDTNLLIYELKKRISNADHYIYIIFKDLNYKKLFTAIKKSLNFSIPIVIVTESNSEIVERLKLYRDVEIFQLKNINFSGFIIDGKRAFLFPSTIDRDSLERSFSLIVETVDKKSLQKFEDLFSTAVRRAIESTQ